MTHLVHTRRALLIGAGVMGASAASGPLGLVTQSFASTSFLPTRTMRGGSNNYSPNAPLVDNLGSGFIMSGRVLKAGTGEPLEGVRIQIWAATTRGGEREPSNHGSVLTAADGTYRLEMEQIVPNFGQPHAHLAYDDPEFETVFLRPVMPSRHDTSLQADFVLAPA
ncbi:MAG: twin-arginine translocation pathway signal [Rhizobiaceae bacterium]